MRCGSFRLDESGQSIILVSVVILSFLMFFSFAINTGLLINAKISVQAAADAAAYSGAAVQARQLNAISFLNYDMLRQYKKFIYRYSFVGSMGSYKFPEMSPAPEPNSDYDFQKRDYSSGSPQTLGLKVPAICIPITDTGRGSDNCSFVNLSHLTPTGGLLNSTGNPILEAFYKSLHDIQGIQDRICQGQGDINIFVLLAWLFRADSSSAELERMLSTLKSDTTNNAATSPEFEKLVKSVSSIVGGLGLFPRNILTLMRIHTLEGFINDPHSADIGIDEVTSWKDNALIADSKERSILAFNSALSNLNTNVFDPNLVRMVELQEDHMLELEDVLINFNAYVQLSGKESTTNGGATHCNATIEPFPVVGAPVGVKIASPPHIHYAIHLKAFVRPHGLLYLPGGDPLELDAYAGAKPFGGRIGPAVIGQSQLTKGITPTPINGAKVSDCDGPTKCYVPYLKLHSQATTYSVNYLKELASIAKQNDKDYTPQGIRDAEINATAPFPQEIGHYNILPPAKSLDEMKLEFIPYSTDPKSMTFRFYAPLFPNGKEDVTAKVKKFLDKIFEKTQVSNNVFKIRVVDMSNLIASQITQYTTNLLPSGKASELNESLTFASIELPMPDNLKKGNLLWLTKAEQVLSSWAPNFARLKSGGDGMGFRPRFGYSVKFVTLHDLQEQGLPTEDEDSTNVSH